MDDKEFKEKLATMHADHNRVMQLIAKMPEPTEEQKQAIREANSPAGWQAAMDDVLAEVSGKKKRQRLRLWLLIGAALVLCALGLAFYRL